MGKIDKTAGGLVLECDCGRVHTITKIEKGLAVQTKEPEPTEPEPTEPEPAPAGFDDIDALFQD